MINDAATDAANVGAIRPFFELNVLSWSCNPSFGDNASAGDDDDDFAVEAGAGGPPPPLVVPATTDAATAAPAVFAGDAKSELNPRSWSCSPAFGVVANGGGFTLLLL